jgi:preprotein translocase subunit SecF
MASNTNFKSKLDFGKIDFVKYINMNVWFSIITFILALVVIFGKGLNYGIDFAGGSEIQVKFEQNVKIDEVREYLASVGQEKTQIQGFGGSSEFLLRFENAPGATDREINDNTQAKNKQITEGLKTKFAAQGAEIRRVDSVGPQVGSQLKRNSILAGFYSLLVILIYVAMRFDYKYAPGAVLSLFHDAIIVLGILVILGREINIQVLAAILTLIGYSLNDTIIVYDRIREVEEANPQTDMRTVINHSINATLSRTMLTTLMTFISTLALYFIAGGVIQEFAFAMILGIVIGTYSSIYVASPLIIWFEDMKRKKLARA